MNNSSIITEIESQLDELQDKIYDYKKLLHENLMINKNGFEEEAISNNIDELMKLKTILREITSIDA